MDGHTLSKGWVAISSHRNEAIDKVGRLGERRDRGWVPGLLGRGVVHAWVERREVIFELEKG